MARKFRRPFEGGMEIPRFGFRAHENIGHLNQAIPVGLRQLLAFSSLRETILPVFSMVWKTISTGLEKTSSLFLRAELL